MNQKKIPTIAYFCMEYGLESHFKIYAGGLGILAGDYLKGAKDEGYPIIGIGIKWKQGYSDQMINEVGRQYDAYHNYEYDFLEDIGLTVEVIIKKNIVKCKVWKCTCFDNADLYLLDTDLPNNPESWTTAQLYGGSEENRVAQEIVLGVGGVKVLRALGIQVDIYHFNEGHALFAGFELLREKMEGGSTFEAAWQATKKEVVFTTHTPVLEGNESHTIGKLMYMSANLGMTRTQLKKLGGRPFNMTVGALRLSRKSNAVAQLHGQTANKMWAGIKGRSEIIAITNGIHLPTWVDEKMIAAAKKGKGLWQRHQENKKALIKFIKSRKGVKLKEDQLLIGFARRSVPYKRANLIFSQPEIIAPLLKSQQIQIIFSGKAHPLDTRGKELVYYLMQKVKQYPQSVVFLENYDMEIGRLLTQGTDVWLNNPRRPKEASGTSGMKAAMNGVLNLSILDGWWPEVCEHGLNGWQFGDAFENSSEAIQDEHDGAALYQVLLKEVLATYQDNPIKWQQMMEHSINHTKEQFGVKRMLKEYYDLLYK